MDDPVVSVLRWSTPLLKNTCVSLRRLLEASRMDGGNLYPFVCRERTGSGHAQNSVLRCWLNLNIIGKLRAALDESLKPSRRTRGARQ